MAYEIQTGVARREKSVCHRTQHHSHGQGTPRRDDHFGGDRHGTAAVMVVAVLEASLAVAVLALAVGGAACLVENLRLAWAVARVAG